MKANFVVRLLLALLALSIFGAYSYLRAAYTPFSGELDAAAQYAASEPLPIAAAPAAEPSAVESVPAVEIAAEPTAEPTPEPTPEPTVDPDSPAGRAAALGLPAPPEIDVTSWEYTLVNGDHSIGQYVPEQLAYLNTGADETDIQLSYNANRRAVDARIAQPLLDMALGCKAAGNPVYLSSGYRSYSDQVANFRRICENNGISDGKIGGYYVTMPAGCSEHQLALCCDITDKYYQTKRDDIVASPTIDWLLAHCAEYGFIHRFPDGKQEITGVMNESWHFRYVGVEAATYIMDNHLCLEEFLALYGVE